MTKLHYGGRTGTRMHGGARTDWDAEVDIGPRLSDGDPLHTYAYAAVRRSQRGEFIDRVCVGQNPKEVNERVESERAANPLFDQNNPVTRVARVTITEG